MPVPSNLPAALLRYRQLLERLAAGRKWTGSPWRSWIEFSTDGVREVAAAVELVGLPHDDPTGVAWDSAESGDKSAESESVAQALVGLTLQEEDRLARTMHISGRLRGAPHPATQEHQNITFLHNRHWRASAGVTWVHGGILPRVARRRALFRRAFHELGLDRQWVAAKEYLQEGAAARRTTPTAEPVVDGIRVRGMGWDRFGAMDFVLTPPRIDMAISMFSTLRRKLLKRTYSYTVSVGGSPAEIERFGRENITAGQIARFYCGIDRTFRDGDFLQLDALGRTFSVQQPAELQLGEDLYELDLVIAKRDNGYHLELCYHRSGAGPAVEPLIRRVERDWELQAKLVEVS